MAEPSIQRKSRRTQAGSRRRAPDRRDATRERLLTAAIDVFGRYGFDATTTRALAEAAGVNLQAIPYHFGGKEGLYIAAADHLAQIISSHVSGRREQIRARIEQADGGLEVAEARQLLVQMMRTMLGLFVSRQSEPWARFILREQMEPTEAFERIYGRVMKPTLEVIGRLVAIILGEEVGSEHVRLRTVTLLGSLVVFRMANAAVLAQLGWESIGPRELDRIHAVVDELVSALGQPGGRA
ncbi:CerR family C-terminal domain-containing protein [Rhodoligotrophos defluvii]|uniref:CerR family C-terminal domain-containing protein n=1 Tax=Rhodoligotrophos defluvii TaxID=2561934 RepID=UPI0010C9AA20|nr:CerR family C-terminal domain-containing protein [Rhodoligotrophos defluvii]